MKKALTFLIFSMLTIALAPACGDTEEKKYRGTGETCDFFQQCDDKNLCVVHANPDGDTNHGICERLGELGEECTEYGCVESAYCDVDNENAEGEKICKARKNLGEPCGFDQCNAQTYCDAQGTDEGVCTARKSVGDPCGRHKECLSELCYSTDEGADPDDYTCLSQETLKDL